MNVFIADKDNRDIVSLIFHYTMLGHRVFLPKPGTAGFLHSPTWPRLLLKSSSDTTKRNIEIHGYEKYDDVKFGEDRFLDVELSELMAKLYTASASCELIDIEKDGIHIDAWHSTPNATGDIDMWMGFAKKHFPHAKWISSCITHWDHSLAHGPLNVVKFLPANYRNLRPDLNQVGMYRNRIEFEIMNIDYAVNNNRKGWASFNHNFAVRQKPYFDMQNRINNLLPEDLGVVNFGGNVRSVGADPKFSGENGVTGKDVTLSPRQAMKKYTDIRGVLHLKQADWAGGVPTMCRFSRTPIIVTQKYIDDTLSNDTLLDSYNCLVRNTEEDIAQAIVDLSSNDELHSRLADGQDKTNYILFSQHYWEGWDLFMRNLR
jgi:hypothetical protein